MTHATWLTRLGALWYCASTGREMEVACSLLGQSGPEIVACRKYWIEQPNWIGEGI